MPGLESSWFLVSALPKDVILKPFYESLKWSVIIAIIAVLLLAGVVTYTILSIVKQLNRVNVVAGQLAGGDLTQKLPVRSKDEFGVMAVHMNDMMTTLRHTISVISEHALSVGSTSQQLTKPVRKIQAKLPSRWHSLDSRYPKRLRSRSKSCSIPPAR